MVTGSTGTSSPARLSARPGGSEVKVLVLLFQDSWPRLNFWLTMSPSYRSSSTGTPSWPAEPPSLSQAALIAPRTAQAPVSGVQKMAGLSLALKVLTRLRELTSPGTTSMFGNPRSLSAGPPSDSYLSRTGP